VAAPGRRDHRTHRHQLTPSRGAFSTYPSPWSRRDNNPEVPTRTPLNIEPRRSWAVLAVALAAQILVVLYISVVNTALTSIGRSLNLGGRELQWLVTAYLMMSGGGLLLGGRMADILPRRTVFLVSLAGFTMASLASGCANNGTGLVGTRALQGAAAALLAPSALSLVMATYGGEERKRGPITDEEPTAAIDEAGYELA
jgi:hypothetical protein